MDLIANTLYLEKDVLKDKKCPQEMIKLAEQESIDVNLKAYLSMLYLNRSTKIFLKVHNKEFKAK